MSRFAPVVPVAIAAALQSNTSGDLFGRYHLVLAHDVLKPEHRELYRKIFERVRESYPDPFIILDNSVVELGEAMSLSKLCEAADIVRANCIVIPDVIGDGEATRGRALEFAEEYNSSKVAYPLMGVIQGRTLSSCMRTLEVYRTIPNLEYLGVPRILTKQHGSRSLFLTAYVRWTVATKKIHHGIHLLGFSDDILDDVACARLPFVQGIDSSVPIRAGSEGQTMVGALEDPSWSHILGPRGAWWEAVTDGDSGLIDWDTTRQNLRTYRRWIGDTNNA